jgi:peroxiredoxin
VACEELLVELQDVQEEFENQDAELVVLGSLPESMETARSEAESRGITYPLLHDAEMSVTRDLGLWSNRMEMPFMGYVIIDMSGRIIAGEQMSLSEAKGAARSNADEILTALQEARQAEALGSRPEAEP